MSPATEGLVAVGAALKLGGRVVVECIDLAIRPGSFVALVGPNGAGKTSALRLLAGEVAPSSGDVFLDGIPLRRVPLRELARRRAVLPQETSIEFAFRAREVVEMGRAPHRGTPAERDDDEVIDRALASTDCSHLADREFRLLSGGERARVNLARILAQEASYVLLDEPTAALDLRHQESVMALAGALAARGCGVLAVVHDLNLAAAYASEVGLMCGGRLEALGSPAEVLRADLLSAAYELPVEVHVHPVRGGPLILAAAPHSPFRTPTP